MTQPDHHILLVEDDPNDAFFLQFAFEEAGLGKALRVVMDGQAAVDYLAGRNEYGDRAKFPFPCLVLLDLKLPRLMGLEVLRWIGERPNLRALLVLVLTSSANISDVDEAYRLGARSYLVKPLAVDQRLQMVRMIKDYWLGMNQFPNFDRSVVEPQ